MEIILAQITIPLVNKHHDLISIEQSDDRGGYISRERFLKRNGLYILDEKENPEKLTRPPCLDQKVEP